MVWPVAFPLEAFLTRAGITALGTAATSEGIKSLQNQGTVNPGVAKEAFMRTLMGPTTEILNRTTDTPSGKVFAPTGEVIESNQIPGMAPAEQPQGLPGLLIPQQEKQVEGMSQASPPTKDKGFTMPTAEDMSILYKKAPVATKELNQLGEDQIKSFIEGQDNLYNDYEIKWNEGKLIKEGGVSKNKLLTKEDIVETYPGQYKPLHRYWEDIWEGGVGDTGQRIAGDIMRASGTETTKEGFSAPSYYEDYRSRLEEHARKTLGKTFPGYRLMSRGEMENLLEGGEATEEVKSYSLSKDKALWFQNFLGNADKKDDLVLAEVPLFSEGLVMRGKPQESEIVYDNQFTFPKEMNFYDLDGNLIKGAEEGMFGKAEEQPTETVPTQDLTVENIQNKIKYKKSKFNNNITEAYLKDKKIAEISKDLDSEKTGSQFNYRINWVNEKGEIDADDYDIETGLNSAKRITAIGFVNTSKSQEKEYLNKLIKAIENKDYDKLNKIREEEGGYDFEGSEFRSKQFNDTINKYRPDMVKLSTEEYKGLQKAIEKPSLTEVDLEEPTTEFTFNEAEVNSFPFNPIDFEKNGILNNPEIIKAFDDLKDDIKIKPPVGFDKDYMVLHQSDSFYVTPPRGQMEITLKYLKKQLEENKASEETVDLIKNLEKDLQAKIKKTGYYGENKEIEDKITNLPGITNKLKKLKGSN